MLNSTKKQMIFQTHASYFLFSMEISELLLVKLKINFHRYKINDSIKLPTYARLPSTPHSKTIYIYIQLSRHLKQKLSKTFTTLWKVTKTRLEKTFLVKEIFEVIPETQFPRKKQINRTNFSQQD